MSSTAIKHLQHLSVTIGPRGATTPQERQAAGYARGQFEALGLETHWEEFRSPVTGWRQFGVAALIGILSLALFWFAGRVGAVVSGVLMLGTAASVILETIFIANPLDWFIRKGTSQNTWARIPAVGEPRRILLLVGHIDSQRTPWFFTSKQRLAFFSLMTTLGVAAFVLSGIIFLVLAWVDFTPLRWLTLVLLPVFVILLALTWQPDTTPHTHGANDNASGAAIVLSLAGQLAASPLPGVEVWTLCSGCEEVGSVGVKAFVQRHKADLGRITAINFDNVGGKGAGVCTITVEGLVVPVRPSAELLALADAVRAAHPEWNSYSKPFTTLGTDATLLMLRKVPALSFLGLTPDGTLPHWHQVSDTFENVDPDVVEQVEAFVMEMAKRLE